MMSWSFETSLFVFLLIAAVSQASAIATKGGLSLPFVLGAACIAGFALGLFPADFIAKSRMRDVGFIAFNVLVVNSGTLLDLRKIRAQRGAALIGLSCAAALAVVLGVLAAPFVGREAALFSIGPVIGGGAASAIASNSAARRAPALAALPWMIFMAQGFFGLPLFAFATRKEASRLALLYARDGRSAQSRPDAARDPTPAPASRTATPLCERVPARFRTTAYYLAVLMLAAVVNRWLYGAFFARLGLHPALTGLLIGASLARLGLVERDPLGKAESMNFLMLGLMALMADSFAATSLGSVLALAPAALAALAVGTAVVGATGALLGRRFAGGAYRGLAIAAACMVSMPPPTLIASGILRSAVGDDDARRFAEAELLPPIGAAWTLISGVVSIAVASVVGILL